MHRHGKVSTEKAKDFKGTIKKLFVYLKPYYLKLFWSINCDNCELPKNSFIAAVTGRTFINA